MRKRHASQYAKFGSLRFNANFAIKSYISFIVFTEKLFRFTDGSETGYFLFLLE